jgi:hypothetical protein
VLLLQEPEVFVHPRTIVTVEHLIVRELLNAQRVSLLMLKENVMWPKWMMQGQEFWSLVFTGRTNEVTDKHNAMPNRYNRI